MHGNERGDAGGMRMICLCCSPWLLAGRQLFVLLMGDNPSSECPLWALIQLCSLQAPLIGSNSRFLPPLKKKNKPKPNILVSPERVQNSFFAFHSSSASLGLQETLLNSNEWELCSMAANLPWQARPRSWEECKWIPVNSLWDQCVLGWGQTEGLQSKFTHPGGKQDPWQTVICLWSMAGASRAQQTPCSGRKDTDCFAAQNQISLPVAAYFHSLLNLWFQQLLCSVRSEKSFTWEEGKKAGKKINYQRSNSAWWKLVVHEIFKHCGLN